MHYPYLRILEISVCLIFLINGYKGSQQDTLTTDPAAQPDYPHAPIGKLGTVRQKLEKYADALAQIAGVVS